MTTKSFYSMLLSLLVIFLCGGTSPYFKHIAL